MIRMRVLLQIFRGFRRFRGAVVPGNSATRFVVTKNLCNQIRTRADLGPEFRFQTAGAGSYLVTLVVSDRHYTGTLRIREDPMSRK